ncbi:hypothetical protein HHL19_21070 [Streptomyces sp. R302]|uniref:hypothetical protein n=1 Tax=unclassified Streptomyces TaxID=2593676 RepID=UPI00145C823C|nr:MULTISPECIES: hypothetical protein [unclassified Streptomyces]NML50996.1 hypothetical protein [Streptomyces sp. R301]NML81090.1 hypothetical protein [Streptomyces sp. R302]
MTEGRIVSSVDAGVRAVAASTEANAVRRAPGGGAPFPPDQAPELVGVAVTLQYLNRMVNVFLEDVPLPPGAPAGALGPVLNVLSRLIRSAARTVGEPGVSPDLLPPAPLPKDLSWAAGAPVVADAFARAARAAEEAAGPVVPDSVRCLLRVRARRMGEHDGGPRPYRRRVDADRIRNITAAPHTGTIVSDITYR